MIRRILDFVLILLFVWVCMIFGLWLINGVIVPLKLPGIKNRVVIAVLKVSVSAGLVLFWLWLWREIIKRMFWHILKSQESPTKRAETERRKKREKPKKSDEH